MVRWRGFSGEPHFGHGRVLDYSESGLRMEVGEPIDPASFVVAGPPGQNKQACAGRVRYCLPKGIKYVVGVQLNSTTNQRHSAPEISEVLGSAQYSLLMFRP
jgi:hypothetical protein